MHNKKILIFISFLISFGFANVAQAGLIFKAPSSIGLISGLVGYWSFDGKDMAGNTAYDRSGNANNGTLTNGPTRAIGKIGQGLSFDGVDDYVLGPDASSLNFGTGNFTVSVWFKTSIAVYSALVNKGEGGSAQVPDYWLFRITDTGALQFITAENDVDTSHTTSATGFYDGVWHHAVGYRNGTTVGIYVDGIDRGSTTGTIHNVSADNTKALVIGIVLLKGAFTWTPFTGSIDDVRIYNRALSADEIKRLYRIGGTLKLGSSQAQNTGSLTKGLVGYWSFDESTHGTTSVADLSGNNNRGFMINGPQKAIGKIGQGLSFDGTDDYVATANIVVSNYTLSAWIVYGDTGQTPRIMGNEDFGTATGAIGFGVDST